MTSIFFSPLYYFHIMYTFSIIILLYQNYFITNEINENRIFNVIKMMKLVMSVMFLNKKHIKINDTQISVIVKLLD